MTTMVHLHTMREEKVDIEVTTHELIDTHELEVVEKYPVVMINHFAWFPSMEQVRKLHKKLGKYLAENVKEMG